MDKAYWPKSRVLLAARLPRRVRLLILGGSGGAAVLLVATGIRQSLTLCPGFRQLRHIGGAGQR